MPGTSATSVGESPSAGAVGRIGDADGRRTGDPVYEVAAMASATGITMAAEAMQANRTTWNSVPQSASRKARIAHTNETARPPVMIGRARLVSPTAPPTSSSTAVSTETRRISPSISGRARMAACVVVAMGAMTLGSMPAANSAAMPARSAPAARRSATRSARGTAGAAGGPSRRCYPRGCTFKPPIGPPRPARSERLEARLEEAQVPGLRRPSAGRGPRRARRRRP